MEQNLCSEAEGNGGLDPQMNLVEAFKVPQLEGRIRLSDLSFNCFRTLSSRKSVKKAIKNKSVFINGSQGYTADFIKGGELIEVYKAESKEIWKSINLDLEVIYEDDYLAVVNKPSGIVVSGNKKWTLENALSKNLEKSSQEDVLAHPEPIHRLDYPTSGVLLVGKTSAAVIQLNKMFEEREIKKKYHAVTIGSQGSHGTIDFPIDNKESQSEFQVLKVLESPKYKYLNLVELTPHSGRRHQLRKHLSGFGNPILGDLLYGKEGLLLKGKGLYLHASSLSFVHPITNLEMNVSVMPPSKFIKLFPDFSALVQH